MKKANIFQALSVCMLLALIMPAVAAAEGLYDARAAARMVERDLAQILQFHEKRLPAEVYLPDGRVNTSHPKYQEVFQDYQRSTENIRQYYKKRDPRYSEWESIIKELKTVENPDLRIRDFTPTGSSPKDVRADMDFTAPDYISGKRVVKAYQKRGNTVQELSDRWIVHEKDLVIWKPKSADAVGSSAAEAGYIDAARPHSDKLPAEGGEYGTSDGKVGRGPDPEGYVISNAKKASDAGIGHKDPRSMQLKDMAKSVDKAGRSVGRQKVNEGFYRRTEGLRKYQTPEEMEVVTFGEKPEVKMKELGRFQKEARHELRATYEKAKAQSSQINAQRTRQANEFYQAGNKEKFIEVRETQIATRSSNEATLKEMARTDPRTVKDVTGIDPTTPQGREKLASRTSEVTGEIMEHSGSQASPGAPVKTGPSQDYINFKKKLGRVMDGLFVAGVGSEAVRKERQSAAEEGRFFRVHKAAWNVVEDTLLAPARMGAEIAREERWKGAKEGRSEIASFGVAVGRTMYEMFVGGPMKMSAQIQEEEALAELEKAKAAGEGNFLNIDRTRAYRLRSLIRIGGELTMMRPIFENLFYDSDADRHRAQMERNVQAYSDARYQEGLTKANVLVGDINEALATGDLQDPIMRSKLEYLNEEYQKTRGELLNVRDRLQDKWGDRVSPELLAKDRVVQNLPETLISISSTPVESAPQDLAMVETGDEGRGGDASAEEAEADSKESDGSSTEEEAEEDGGGFRVIGEKKAKGDQVERARESSGGEFADPDDPETQEALRVAEEFKRNPPPRPSWEIEWEQMERDYQRKMQESQQDIARAFQDMSRVIGQIARDNQRYSTEDRRSSSEPKLPYDITPVGPTWDPKHGWGPPRRRPMPSSDAAGTPQYPQNQPGTQTQVQPPPGGSSSGSTGGGMSWDACVNKYCPMCANQLTILDVTPSDACNNCKSQKHQLISSCASAGGGSRVGSGASVQDDNYWKKMKVGPRSPSGFDEGPKVYYAARKYQPKYKNYHYVIGKKQYSGLAGHQIVYGPDTFMGCRRWLISQGHWQ